MIVSISLNAQKGNLFYSNWHNGGNSEVNTPKSNYAYFKKGQIYYNLSNDKDYIYLDMLIEDAGVQTRILKEGLTIWIDMEGKSSRKLGVRFPIGSQNSSGRNRPDQKEKLNPDGSIVTPLQLANTIELIGFINEEVRRLPAENAENFSGSVKFDKEGILHYSMIMPLAKLPVRNSKDGNGAMPFAFGIQYGLVPVMNAPRGPSSEEPSSAPPSGGRGGGGSGRSRGGSGSGGAPGGISPSSRQGSGETVLPPVLFWIKNIKLASDR
jgi:hypothetical protein